MDEHNELPDDFSQWSNNNWELFNLDPQNASYNDLRKAYSKLIKRFRPETHPEHFQRIQEAFETLRDLIQSGKASSQEESSSGSDSESEEEQRILERCARRQAEFLDTLYKQYIYKTDWDGAKNYLESLIPPEDSSEEIPEEITDLEDLPYLYMFWLLYVTNPSEEDNFPEICKYLIQGDNRIEANVLTLCIRTFFYFLERNNLSSKDSVYDYSLSHLNFPAITLLLNVRWVNLRFEEGVDDVDVILGDLERLKKRFMHKDLRAWARINIEAIEHLLWIDSPKAKQAIDDCMKEISELPGYEEVFEEKLDFFDQVELLTESLENMPKILPVDIDSIQILLLMSGNSALTRHRRFIQRIAAGLANDVLKAFMVFDYIHQNHSSVASHLLEPLHNLYLNRHDDSESLDESVADRITKRILQSWDPNKYSFELFRLAFLRIFLEEQVDPVNHFRSLYAYFDSIKENPDKKAESDQIEKYMVGFVNDNTIILTYYAVMCCEIYEMEKMEDD
ncbi:MAG: hypothetical protein IJQ39_04865 [Thermoguttaceae bacterium]|nr:hypothetical protein [Thermoguttaceae bacterium]